MADLHENIIKGEQGQKLELRPGFRFHPTDEELILHYLFRKTLDSSFISVAIGEADLKKVEPWELPWKANMGEEEWYFFCLRERRYPTGQRTNRGTASGYWKATGKDKEIFGGKSLVGMKKTLVFYTGRAPKGVKSNWVMHEFRLDGIYSKDNLPDTAQGEWVISKVFNKNASGKKTHISDLQKPNSEAEDIDHQHQPSTSLPPLTDSSPRSISFETKPTFPINQPSSLTPGNDDSSSFSFDYCADSFFNHDQSFFKFLIDENGDDNDLISSLKLGKSEDTGASGSGDGGGGSDFGDDLSTRDPFDVDYLINC